MNGISMRSVKVELRYLPSLVSGTTSNRLIENASRDFYTSEV
jgi:hypothetical protein